MVQTQAIGVANEQIKEQISRCGLWLDRISFVKCIKISYKQHVPKIRQTQIDTFDVTIKEYRDVPQTTNPIVGPKLKYSLRRVVRTKYYKVILMDSFN